MPESFITLRDHLAACGWDQNSIDYLASIEPTATGENRKMFDSWVRRINKRAGHPLPKATRPRKQRTPPSIRWLVWERDNFTCQHCGRRTYLSVDHIEPEARGGALDLDNLQTLCIACNSSKGTRQP